jgi:molybdate transport system ATP-binding protein
MAIECDIKKKFKDFEMSISFITGSERLGILGASGSGKSMTLKCLAGIETPDRGRILLNNRVLFDSKQNINVLSRNRKVGYLFQSYALFPHLTVEQNVGIGIAEQKQKRDIIAHQMARFQLTGLEKRYPSQLSGGQQQRVALARIMANEPEVILLDEPFSALDSYLKDTLHEQLLEMLTNYAGDVVIVSHNLDEIYQFCERLVVIEKGTSIMTEDTQKVFQQPRRLETAKLTGCKNISPISRIDSHCIKALAWGVTLYTNQSVTEDITHVGIRALHIQPAYEKKAVNCMRIKEKNMIETLFQKHFTMCQIEEDRISPENQIRWYVSKEEFHHKYQDQVPPYLYLPPEQLMLLTN